MKAPYPTDKDIKGTEGHQNGCAAETKVGEWVTISTGYRVHENSLKKFKKAVHNAEATVII